MNNYLLFVTDCQYFNHLYSVMILESEWKIEISIYGEVNL